MCLSNRDNSGINAVEIRLLRKMEDKISAKYKIDKNPG